jgi:hypothetical protein
MDTLASPVLMQIVTAALIFVAGFLTGASKAERRNRRYRRIWEI